MTLATFLKIQGILIQLIWPAVLKTKGVQKHSYVIYDKFGLPTTEPNKNLLPDF